MFWTYCCLQKWRSKIPPSVQWISGLSRGVSTKAALRLFVVTLCVLITLLMAILNYVSYFNLIVYALFCSVDLISWFISTLIIYFILKVFLPGNNCTAITNRTELEGLRLYTGPVSTSKRTLYLKLYIFYLHVTLVIVLNQILSHAAQ